MILPHKGKKSALSVLLLRPRKAAESTAVKLRHKGFKPYIVPLSTIKPAPFPSLLATKPFTAVLASSANAFSQTENLPAHLKTLPLYCVGSKTAEAAKTSGFKECRFIGKNITDLVCFLQADLAEEAFSPATNEQNRPRLLYLAGRPRRSVLENFLTKQQISYTIAEMYETKTCEPDIADLALLPQQVDNILLYSVQNAQALNALAEYINGQTQILCLSPRIKAALPQQWQKQARVAQNANEAALFTLLAKQA